jgi:hypothetical protein
VSFPPGTGQQPPKDEWYFSQPDDVTEGETQFAMDFVNGRSDDAKKIVEFLHEICVKVLQKLDLEPSEVNSRYWKVTVKEPVNAWSLMHPCISKEAEMLAGEVKKGNAAMAAFFDKHSATSLLGLVIACMRPLYTQSANDSPASEACVAMCQLQQIVMQFEERNGFSSKKLECDQPVIKKVTGSPRMDTGATLIQYMVYTPEFWYGEPLNFPMIEDQRAFINNQFDTAPKLPTKAAYPDFIWLHREYPLLTGEVKSKESFLDTALSSTVVSAARGLRHGGQTLLLLMGPKTFRLAKVGRHDKENRVHCVRYTSTKFGLEPPAGEPNLGLDRFIAFHINFYSCTTTIELIIMILILLCYIVELLFFR